MSLMKEELAETSPDWANILGDMLRCIADKIHSVQDRIRLGAVCRSWRASLEDKKINFPVCLMLAEKQNSDKRCFYNISGEIFIDLELPEIRRSRCWGSPFGWLATSGLDLEIQLFNPLSRASLPLPPLRTFTHQQDRPPEQLCKHFISKLLLSSSPTSPDCIVLAIYSEFSLLAFAKPGDQAWIPIDATPPFFDAICFNGNFFAARHTGQLFICEDLYGTHPKAVEFASQPPIHPADMKYLFDLCGNLGMISRIVEPSETSQNNEDVEETFVTVEFEIYKLDMHTRSWEKIFLLGDRSLFLANCYTFSIVAADYPGCRPNCIYFTDDYDGFTGGSDIGIYSCHNFDNKEKVDRRVDPFPKSDNVLDLRSSFSLPLWIIPCSH
ncbi:hypothetical protein REPUB_Repub17cG0169700 [Reevesia pubescens]